jgi:orotate phosphoribosyltransferase
VDLVKFGPTKSRAIAKVTDVWLKASYLLLTSRALWFTAMAVDATRGQAMPTSLPSGPEARRRLIEIVRQKSYRSGSEFKLASGKTSTVYFNMKPTMLDPEGGLLAGVLIFEVILSGELSGASPLAFIGGLEMGAVPLATSVAIASYLGGSPMRAVFVRKVAKEHGTQSLVEGLTAGETLSGKRGVVLEDVTTTGGSALRAVSALRDAGAIVDRVVTLLDREDGAQEALAGAGLRLDRVLSISDFKY